MTHVLIIEDEMPAARRLKKMLQKEDVQVDAILPSVSEALEYLNNNPEPDLILSDIQLSDGISFDIFEKVQPACPIIFTTAYDQYAINAFKHNGIDYLLKPFSQDELHTAIDKFRKTQPAIDYQKLIQSLQPKRYKQRFACKYGQHIKSIADTDIAYFYSMDKTSYLVTVDGETFIYENSLESIAGQVNPKRFFRVNRGFIVSFESIRDILAYSNSRLRILLKPVSQTDVIVARERVKDFKSWLEN